MIRHQTFRTTRQIGHAPEDEQQERMAIIAAATRSFAAHGFDGTDMRSIAATAGVNANRVRALFGGRADLWNACADSIVSEASPIIDRIVLVSARADRSCYRRLSDIILTTAAFYRIHADVRDFVFRAMAEGSERTAFIAEKLLAPAYEAARPSIDEGMRQGIVRCSHPALFFVIMTSALSQPAFFPVLLGKIAAEMPPDDVHWVTTRSLISMLLSEPRDGSS